MDIAAMYFLNSITVNVKEVKFLFLVTHSSVIPGNDRLDFDLLVTHAGQFLQNMEKYNMSIGLVVTKLNSYSEWGKYLTDDKVLLGIVGFLKQFHLTLKADLETLKLGKNEKSLWQRKIQFVNAILQQDDQKQYSRIWVLRNPPQCGRFSDIPYIYEVKNKIEDLYMNKLEFRSANPMDFGFTLKSETLLQIERDYVPEIKAGMETSTNEAVVNLIKIYQTDFQIKFNSKREMRVALVTMYQIHANLSNWEIRSKTKSCYTFLQKVECLFNELGYKAPSSYISKIKQYEDMLKFYERVTMITIEQLKLEPVISKLDSHVRKIKEQTLKYITDIWIPDIVSKILDTVVMLVDALNESFMNNLYFELNQITLVSKTTMLKNYFSNLQKLQKIWGNLLPQEHTEYTMSNSEHTIIYEMSSMYSAMGQSIPNEYLATLEQYENLLDFFGNVTKSPPKRNLGSWLQYPTKFIGKLANYRDWYDFMVRTADNLRLYTTQNSIPQMDKELFVLTNGDLNSGLDVLKRYKATEVTSNIEEIYKNVATFKDKKQLHDVVQNALTPTSITCTDNGKKVVVTGNFVKFSDFLPWSKVENCSVESLNELDIFASEVLFFDNDLIAKGQKLTMTVIADTWEVILGKTNRHRVIDLSGVDGEAMERAQSGSAFGEDGKDGLPGNPGGNGGNFYGIYRRIVNGAFLEININGGNGGNGQAGGNGREGENGSDGTEKNLRMKFLGFRQLGPAGPHSSKKRKIANGKYGSKGGNGGHGGAAGPGGFHGYEDILNVDGAKPDNIVIKKLHGKNGLQGNGGVGARGGKNGGTLKCVTRKILIINVEKDCIMYRSNKHANTGKKGIKGGSNKSSVNPVTPPNPGILWQTICAFKMYIMKSHNGYGRNFVSLLDNMLYLKNTSVSVDSLAEELVNLESYFCTNEAALSTIQFEYEDFLRRVGDFNKTAHLTSAQSFVLNKLRVSALSRLMAVNEQQTPSTMVVNVADYFITVNNEMLKLKTAQIDFRISKSNQNFRFQLESKIKEAQSLISEQVLPSLVQLETRLEECTDETIRELNVLKKSALETEEELRHYEAKLKKSILLEKIVGGLKLVGNVAKFFGPKGAVVSTAISVLTNSISYASKKSIGEPPVIPSEFAAFMESNHEKYMTHKTNSVSIIVEMTEKIIKEQNLTQLSTSLKNFQAEYFCLQNLTTQTSGVTAELGISAQLKFEQKFNELVDAIVRTKASLFANQSTIKSQLEYLFTIVTVANTNYPLVAALQEDRAVVSKVSPEMANVHELLQNIENRKQAIYQGFVPIVKTAMSSLYSETSNLTGSSLSALSVRKWKVQGMLKDVKLNLQRFVSGLSVEEEILVCIEKLRNTMDVIIDLYDHIEKYEETMQLADYIADINSHGYANTNDPVIKKVDFYIKANLFLYEYQTAMNAFKQWAFPFAGRYLANQHLENQISGQDLDSTVNMYANKIDTLSNHLQKYKAMVVKGDAFVFKSHFSSDYKSTEPFFVWKNHQWNNSIYELLAGNQIQLYADVWKSNPQKAAVKFKTVELYLKTTNGTMQNELQESLNHFRMAITHSGISYYKFLHNVFVMKGTNQTLEYSFEKINGSNIAVSENIVGHKFDDVGDYLLSPYTYWTFQLIEVKPSSKNINKLLTFASSIDLELRGEGIYINEERAGISKLQELNVDSYYHTENVMSGASIDISNVLLRENLKSEKPLPPLML